MDTVYKCTIPEMDESFWREARLVEPDRTEQITLQVKRSVSENC